MNFDPPTCSYSPIESGRANTPLQGRDTARLCHPFIQANTSDLPAIMLNDRQGYTRSFDPRRKNIPFEVFAADRSLRFSISFLPRPVLLAELVPMTCQLSQVLIDATSRQIEESDRRIACRKGCDACCSYMIPISPAEAYHIRDEIYKLPPHEQRTLFRSCQHSASRLIQLPPPPNMATPTRDPEERIEALSNWYKTLNLPCPFLVNHACCIYEFRPLACREYMVTSHPSKCQPSSSEKTNRVPIPVSIAEVLAITCQILEDAESSILLPLLTPFLQEQPSRSWTLFPAEQVVETFLEVLNDQAHRNCLISCTEPAL